LAVRQKLSKIAQWAEKYGQDEALVTLMAAHLGGAAARRAAWAAQKMTLPLWSEPLCPICGGRPHGSSIKGKEGKRYLHCSLCRHEWLFSRTTCPACRQDSPQEAELFFFEDSKQMRAEVCTICKHYLLCVDTRELLDDTPVELFLLCMMPLDLLMQEKKYIPLSPGVKRR
jgi:FdhE protein